MQGFSGDQHFSICLRCLGRAYATIGHGLSNVERGSIHLSESLQVLSENNISIVEEEKCSICRSVFMRIGDFADLALRKSSGYEFNTFLAGSTFPKDVSDVETLIQDLLGNRGESIKKEFNREVGKAISDLTGKSVDKASPDMTFHFDLEYYQVKLEIRSLYIYGIYMKNRRGIPQTRWIHQDNNGISVEQIIGDVVLKHSQCTNYFLHGSGREDVDVRMQGNGREFVLEAENPKKRSIDLRVIQDEINRSGDISVGDLNFTSRETVVKIKGANHDKSYRVTITGDNQLDPQKFGQAVSQLSGKDIYQRTPLRVSSRRSDLVRRRNIREMVLEQISGNTAICVVRAEAGTYIKELIHGDEGRTNPSLSSEYGSPLKVQSLDVIWIYR
ncbi:MAG: tRNA pseudouridine(54/55) synthase Pus10 [Thermoplasmataceae archaeon]